VKFNGEFDERYIVSAGDIVVGMDGDFRVARWTGEPALLNQRVCKITLRDESFYDPRFLLHVLPGYLDAINARTSSVTVKHLSSRTVLDIPLPLPPVAEQRRIVAAIEEQFSRADAADHSLQLARQRLEAFREAVLSQATSGEWPYQPLATVLTSLRNGTFVSRPAAAPPGIPIFRISAVRPLALDVDDIRFAQVDAGDVSTYFVNEGDLLFTRYSGNAAYVGACAPVPGLPRPTLHPDKLIRAVVDRSLAEPVFLAIALNSGRSRRAIEERRKTTAGQVGIAGSELKRVPVPVPPLDEQQRIVADVTRQLTFAEHLEAAVTQTQRRAGRLRHSLLHRAFTGQLVPQDPVDEPATVLLERVLAQANARPKSSRRTRRVPA
jgi:type I restriction enzyme, S subunit